MTKFTQQHYVAIAAQIKEVRELKSHSSSEQFNKGWDDACIDLAMNLAGQFERDNSKFKRALFMRACGMSEAL